MLNVYIKTVLRKGCGDEGLVLFISMHQIIFEIIANYVNIFFYNYNTKDRKKQ